jgi:putative tryptophan/tyrosine transport system substrate-binding protein
VRRREFITLLGGAAATWPLAARAQQTTPVIGALYSVAAEPWADKIAGLRRGLSEADFVEGRNLTIEYRWADGDLDRLPVLAEELVTRKVAAIVAGGSLNSIRAAMAATQSIPIIFTTATDPVTTGLVASLNRPGANITGAPVMGEQLVPKLFEVLHEVLPAASNIAVLVNPSNSTVADILIQSGNAAAARFGLELVILRAGTEAEIDTAFARASEQHVEALVMQEAYFSSRKTQIAALALRHSLPVITGEGNLTQTGVLIDYGADIPDAYRQAGVYAGRILKGEKPADLPVLQPTKFRLIVNLRTAKALGLKIPESFLVRADEVIE